MTECDCKRCKDARIREEENSLDMTEEMLIRESECKPTKDRLREKIKEMIEGYESLAGKFALTQEYHEGRYNMLLDLKRLC